MVEVFFEHRQLSPGKRGNHFPAELEGALERTQLARMLVNELGLEDGCEAEESLLALAQCVLADDFRQVETLRARASGA